jgi:hypothetical protein
VDAGIVAVLKVTGPKLFGFPLNPIFETETPLMVIVTVPVSIWGPLTLPLSVIDTVPNVIDCEAVKPAKAAVSLLTVRVKFCVALVPTPLLAVMVNG